MTVGGSWCRNSTCSLSGALGALGADDDRAERAAERVERVVRAVVVVGPDADGVRRRLPRVGELLAGGDEAADARVLAEVDAVVVRRVLHAVRVHRQRLVELGRVVAEVDDERVADLRVERRARACATGRPGRRSRASSAGRRAPGTCACRGCACCASRRAWSARRPTRATLRLHPVLALDAAGLRLRRAEDEVVDRVVLRPRRAGAGPARRARRPCARRRDRRAGPPCRRACTAGLRHRLRRGRRKIVGWRCGRASGWRCSSGHHVRSRRASIGGVCLMTPGSSRSCRGGSRK